MSLPIKIYKQFEVVVVPFPFTDSGAVKRRPALVLSDEVAFNVASGRSVLAMITTVKPSSWVLDVLIEDLEAVGLKHPSSIRMKLFTLDNPLIIKSIGHLAEVDRVSVEKALKKLFCLTN